MRSQPILRRINTAPLHERIYQALKSAIVHGHFVPGQPITIRELAVEFGTSAMPVRDALTRLVAERAVEMPSSRAFRIPLMSRQEFIELCELRILIECNAVALACKKLSAEELDNIEMLDLELTRQFFAKNLEATLDANADLLFTIFRATKRAILVSHIESLWVQSGPYLIIRMRQMADDPVYQSPKRLGHHGELLMALRNRDPEAAALALERDITDTTMSYLPEKTFPD